MRRSSLPATVGRCPAPALAVGMPVIWHNRIGLPFRPGAHLIREAPSLDVALATSCNRSARVLLADRPPSRYGLPMSRNDDRSAALGLLRVSRETLQRFDRYVALLAKWRKTVNLISESTFSEIWTRHIADSAQLLAFAPEAKIWVDMGSGAGFPGLVLAIQLVGTMGARVHLIESDQRKSAFLREAARETGASVEIHNMRVEKAVEIIQPPVDAVTARALAPLPRLVDFAKVWLDSGAIGVFPRGKTAGAQADIHSANQNFSIEFSRSRIDAASEIAIVRAHPASATFDRPSAVEKL
jgi:16S rRNA (guanine527-N7)-methyltransferase